MTPDMSKVKKLSFAWLFLFLCVYCLVIIALVGCESARTHVKLHTGDEITRERVSFLQTLTIDTISYTDENKIFEMKGYKNEAKDELAKALIQYLVTP